MNSVLDPQALGFFFGAHFNVDVALEVLRSHCDNQALRRELSESIQEKQPHFGLQLVGYQDVDTGLSTVALRRDPKSISGVSFYADSKHRLFGGTLMVCVPLAFCSTVYQPVGDYIVYRHTYKRPSYDPTEIERVMKTGTEAQRFNAFIYTKSREAYQTIPGMSYVGITNRAWQTRYKEHVEAAMTGASSTLFHEAVRSMQGQQVVCIHDVSAYGLTQNKAREVESELISRSTLRPLGLNMKR